MRLTKHEHACVRIEKDGAAVVIDPGVWNPAGTLAGASAVLVTHEHFDHLDVDMVSEAMGSDTDLRLWAPAPVAAKFADFAPRVHTVSHGDRFETAGFGVHVYGSEHAVIYPDAPLAANCGFLVDGEVFHPGDALTVPDVPVSTLLLPVNAPWLKVSEMVDYVRAVSPGRGYGIHDGLLNANGVTVTRNWLQFATKPLDGSIELLEPGTAVDL